MTEPLRVSWSRLKDWEACHLRSSLHRQGKRAEIVDGRNFLAGTLADRAMRRFLEQDDGHQLGQMAEFVDDLWDEHAVHSAEYKIRWRGDPREDQARVRAFAKLVVTNLEPFLFDRVLPHEYQPELRFVVPMRLPDLQGHPRLVELIGGMDIAVLELPDRSQAWLYDLKATEHESYIQSTLGQLIFYGIAWSIMRKHPAERIGAAFLAPACKTQYFPLDVTMDDRRQMLARIIRYCQARWNETSGDLPAVDAEGEPVTAETCWGCDVRHACTARSGVTVTDTQGRHRASIAETVRARQGRT